MPPGRRRPTPIEGSEFTIDCDLVVVAIGTRANPLLTGSAPDLDVNEWGYLVADEYGMTSMPGVFAGGDIVRGAATVILAMGDGKRSAAAIDCVPQRGLATRAARGDGGAEGEAGSEGRRDRLTGSRARSEPRFDVPRADMDGRGRQLLCTTTASLATIIEDAATSGHDPLVPLGADLHRTPGGRGGAVRVERRPCGPGSGPSRPRSAPGPGSSNRDPGP